MGQTKYRVLVVFDDKGCERSKVRDTEGTEAAQVKHNGNEPDGNPEQSEGSRQAH